MTPCHREVMVQHARHGTLAHADTKLSFPWLLVRHFFCPCCEWHRHRQHAPPTHDPPSNSFQPLQLLHILEGMALPTSEGYRQAQLTPPSHDGFPYPSLPLLLVRHRAPPPQSRRHARLGPPRQDPTTHGLVCLGPCRVLRPTSEAPAGAQTSVDLGEGLAHLLYLPLKLPRRLPHSYPALERRIQLPEQRLCYQAVAHACAPLLAFCVLRPS